MDRKHELIDLAKLYIRGEDISSKIDYTVLYEELIRYDQFGYATEILLLRMEDDQREGARIDLKDYQELARNVYKDTTLSSYFKFDKALSILKTHCSLEKNPNNETLGLAGAIYKYKWKFDHQFKHLLESQAYYKKGYTNWINQLLNTETDFGYTAINYAYICELIVIENLEQISAIAGITDETINSFFISQRVRKEIIIAYVDEGNSEIIKIKKSVVAQEWLYATLAEAYFGLRLYDQALYCINQYTQNKNFNWQLKTFTQQLYEIASFQATEKEYGKLYPTNPFDSEAINEDKQKICLLALDIEHNNGNGNSDDKNQEYKSRKKGKFGIGLSGGGHRSALFHIGVLAGLAEKDMLKDLEVISCVSGGSIIGVYYYLKLKNLLEKYPDDTISQQDYINIVQEIEKEYLAAIQKNMRVRLFTNLWKNIKMIKGKKYSRTHRIGELYEDLLYLPLVNSYRKKKDPKIKTLVMSDLIIDPLGESPFNIYNDNWKRKNKVPQLILNATSLNTGHNWQFTASWMGEPPTFISDDLDVKPRLRRMYYENAPDDYKKFRLGYAVAASSCVPVLFEPLFLKGLYDDIDLELVDGGVHDNQGIASILQQECANIIISDGSSQMVDNKEQVGNELSLFFRVDNILQERVREIQLLDLKSRSYTSMINSLIIVHLKNGLSQQPISWKDCTDMEREIFSKSHSSQPNTLLYYGIMKHIQKLISEIRTDLDSHNDMESYALMFSGYQQITHYHTTSSSNKSIDWGFKVIEDSCTLPDQDEVLLKQLTVSTSVFFKIIKLSKWLRYILFTVCLIPVVCLLYILYKNWYNDCSLFCIDLTYKIIGITLLTLAVGYLSKILVPFLNPIGFLKKKLIWLSIVFIGFLATNIYLLLFNRLYNKLGKL